MLFSEPFAPWTELSRELDRFAGRVGLRSFVPPADVLVTDEDVTVVMDVPGLTVDDLAVELQGDTLTVRGERKLPDAVEQDDQRAWQRLERGFGQFEHSLRVPAGLDPDGVEASMADGVLTLRIAKPASRRTRRIAIATAGGHPVIEQGGDREAIGTTA